MSTEEAAGNNTKHLGTGRRSLPASVLLLLILFTCFSRMNPDNLNYHFTHISNKDGLPHNTVNCVIQDRSGSLWIGTEKGVCRYDGYTFRNYPFLVGNGLAPLKATVNSMILDASGALWTGTNGGGLKHFHSDVGLFDTHLPEPGNPLSPSNKVFAIYMDDKGILWVGTMGNGLFSFSKDSGLFTRYILPVENNSTHENRVNTISPYSGRYFLVGTSSGLYKFDPVTHTAVSMSVNVSGGSAFPVKTVFTDSRNRIWTGTSSGVFMLDRKTEQLAAVKTGALTQLDGTTVNTIHEDPYQRMWIGSWSGLYIVEKGGDIFTKFSSRSRSSFDLTSRFITDIYEDKSGVIWVSTTNGLNKYNLAQGNFRYYDLAKLTSGQVNTGLVLSVFEEKEDILWIGLYEGGLIRYNRSDGSCICYSERSPAHRRINGNSVMDIQSDGEGTVYAGTLGGGLNVLREGGLQIKRYINIPEDRESISNDYISSILVLAPDRVLIGTWDGLNLFNPATGKFLRFYLPRRGGEGTSLNRIGSVFMDSRDRIWVGTLGGGLYRFVRETGDFVHFGKPGGNGNSGNPDLLYGIREDSEGKLWLASFSGLLRFDPASGIWSFGDQQLGSISDSVWDILRDSSGDFWLSTSMGISRMSPATGDRVNLFVNDEVFINFMTPGNGCMGAGNEMFFGGEGGILSFHPREVGRSVPLPNVAITSGTAFQDGIAQILPLLEHAPHILSHRNDLISFQFSTFNYPNPAKSEYRYRLRGDGGGWVNLGNKNTVSFSDLSPGRYEFQVQGSNGGGIWSKTTARLRFRILPPFWGTWWFRGLVFLMLTAVLLYFHFTRMARLKRKLTREEKIRELFRRSGISRREEEIVYLLLEGKTSRQIEDILFISNGTIRNHIYSIYKKLKVKNRVEFANLFKNFNHRLKNRIESPENH